MKKVYLCCMCLIFFVGSVLIVPVGSAQAQRCGAGETVHVIQSGENLFRIAQRYGVSMEAIAQRNNIVDITRIFAGDTLCIPGVTTIVIIPQITPPQEDNWCFPGEPWGDGRCNNPDPSIHIYNWRTGWCAAAIEDGRIQGTIEDCLASFGEIIEEEDDDDDDDDKKKKKDTTEYCYRYDGDEDLYYIYRVDDNSFVTTSPDDPGYSYCGEGEPT